MKLCKIINGRKYNTRTAIEIGRAGNKGSSSDFSWWMETLYLKQNGEFFIVGEGGPMSRYGRCLGNREYGFGEEINPISYNEAREWAEKNCNAEMYESIFGTIQEDICTIPINVRNASAEKLRKAAEQEGKSISSLIEEYVRKIE